MKRFLQHFFPARLSLFTWAMTFFICLVIVRGWYFFRGLFFPNTSFFELISLFLLGVLQDAWLVAVFIIPFQWLNNYLIRLPRIILNTLVFICILFVGVLIVYAFSNVEFFLSFGSHMNLAHISHLTESEKGVSLFVTDQKLAWLSLLYWVAIPLAFLICSVWVKLYHVEFYLLSGSGRSLILTILMVGLATHWMRISDPLKANFVENSIFSFLKDSAVSDELFNRPSGDLEKVLDTAPLEKKGEHPQPWVFFDSRYPLMKATEHDLCRMGLKSKAECGIDRDSDGSILQADCNDWDSRIHPGAHDIPGDSIDQDCSGLDAAPPNVVFIFWEGARAVNVGSLGAAVPATPRFDAIVKKHGVLFRNAYANSPQTRWSIIPIYYSNFDRLSSKWILKFNPDLKLLAFPEILRAFGYYSVYVHSGNLSISNLSTRIKEWSDEFYDSHNPPFHKMKRVGWSVTDKDLFKVCYDFLTSKKLKSPYVFCIQTGSLHYPYLSADSRFDLADHSQKKNQVANIIHYSDHYLGEFLEKLLADPKFDNTLFIIAPDHGINYYAPHNTGVQNMNYEDLVWIPMALIGKKWGLEPGVDDEIRQMLDVGPTILDRLGLEIPNSFVGHSLLRSFGTRTPRAFFLNPNGGYSAGLREGNWKYWINFKTGKRYLFNLEADREESKNLAYDDQHNGLTNRYLKMVQTVFFQNNRLIRDNRIYDPKYGIDPAQGQGLEDKAK